MIPLERVRKFSIADYHKMGEIGIFAPDERVELIEGMLRKMAPIGATHAWIVDQVTKVFSDVFRSRFTVRIQNPIILSDDSEPQPDASMVHLRRKGETPRTPRSEDVYLVVEVSDTTLNFDRTVKVPLYARAEIPEVWIIDTTASLIEQYLSPQAGAYQVIKVWRTGDTIPTSLGVGIEVDKILL
jgi:Uma2 family endonuclease